MCTTVPSPVALGRLTVEVADPRVRPADQTEQRLTSRRWVGSLVLHHHLTAVSPCKESQAFYEVRDFSTQLYSLIGVSHAQELCC